MGLEDRIRTWEARKDGDQNIGPELAVAYGMMAERKSSQRLFWYWFDKFVGEMKDIGRFGELIELTGGIDPSKFGWTDAQDIVRQWLGGRL